MFHFVAYNILVHLILLCAAPYLLVRALCERNFRPILKRFGRYSSDIPSGGLWIHAVSVGEVVAAKTLVRALRKRFPQTPLVLTTSTVTGQGVAKKTFADHAGVSVVFFPFDVPFAVKRALSRLKPSALVILETELWPNVIRHAAARAIPLILLNGRISSSSMKRYRYVSPLIRRVLRQFDVLGMRTREDAQRIIELGAERSKVTVTGNLKFEASLLSISDEVQEELTRKIGLRDDERLVVAGSTHAGEEELVLEVFKRLEEQVPGLILLLAPRHVTRLNGICDAIRRAGLEFVLRTDTHGADEVRQVIVLDTTGELATLYALGELAVVGGSFVEGVGGHNPLEPAAAGIPVLFGQHMESFVDITERLGRHDGCIQVRDAEELYASCCELLCDREARERVGRNARETVVSGGGAVAESMAVVEGVLHRTGTALS